MSAANHTFRAVALAALLALSQVLPARAQEVVTVTTLRGATIKYLALAPSGPAAAAVILLAGGNGALGLDATGTITTTLEGNFLIRSRQLFVDNGLYVAALDVASDHSSGLTMSYRLQIQHAQDVRQVVVDVRTRASAPVWLVGTSAGTLSVANTATRGRIYPPAPPHGIVFTSTLTHKSMGCPKSVGDVSLGFIRLPTLIVSHRDDACTCTPSVDADALSSALTGTSVKEVQLFTGGDPPISAPCQAKSQHGYFGIEATVVGASAAWIKAH
jgi:hypothetical protein